jgi:hypothetical protein
MVSIKIICYKIISIFYKFNFKIIIGNSINIPLIFNEGRLPIINPCICMRNARPYIYMFAYIYKRKKLLYIEAIKNCSPSLEVTSK